MKLNNMKKIVIVLLIFPLSLLAQKNILLFGNDGVDKIKDMQIVQDNYLITGFFQNEINGVKCKGNSDAFIAKMDFSGKTKWFRAIGSSFKNNNEITEYGQYIKTIDNQIYVAGKFYTSIDRNITSKGKNDVFLVKYDLNGNEKWIKSYGSYNADDVKGLHLYQNNIYLIIQEGVTHESKNDNTFLLKISPEGNLLFKKKLTQNGQSVIIDTIKYLDDKIFAIKRLVRQPMHRLADTQQ